MPTRLSEPSLAAPRSASGITPGRQPFVALALALLLAAGGVIFLLGHDSSPSLSYAAAVHDPVRYGGSLVSWRCTITHAVPRLSAVACRIAPYGKWLHTGEIVAGLAAGKTAHVPAPGTRVTVSGVLGLPLVDASDPPSVRSDLWVEGATVTR